MQESTIDPTVHRFPLSVVVTTCNSLAALRETLDSLLRQTFQDFEVILEDGLSSDDTLLTIRQTYMPRFGDRLKVFSERDTCLFDGLNKGTTHTTGYVLCFLQAGEVYEEPTVLSAVLEALQNDTIACVYGDASYVKADDAETVVKRSHLHAYTEGIFKDGWCPVRSSLFIRDTTWTSVGEFDTSLQYNASLDWMLRLFVRQRVHIQYLARPLVRVPLQPTPAFSFSSEKICLAETNLIMARYGLHPSWRYRWKRLKTFLKTFFQL